MLMIANVLALALVAADGPKAPKTPASSKDDVVVSPTGSFFFGAVEIPLTGFEPDAPQTGPPPKVARPSPGGDDPKADELWRMTLPEAIRIGLDHSEVVRVISLGAQGGPAGGSEPTPGNGSAKGSTAKVVIARLNADASAWQFKAGVMALLRSIEQQYWALAQQQVALASREAAVKLGEEILKREKADLEGGRSNPANVAEAEQQLENFKLNLVTATSDVITAERQLRDLLGLPAADNRRVVPVSAPVEARLEPDWEASLRVMLESQPDIAEHQTLVRMAEIQLLLARNQLLPYLKLNDLYQINGLGRLGNQGPMMIPGVSPVSALARAVAEQYPAGFDFLWADDLDFTHSQVTLAVPVGPYVGRAPLANTRQAQYQLLNQRAALQDVIHQGTHSLARFFLEVDANYKQFRTAQRLRAAAQDRLAAQRAFYDEGRVTIDRLLDAVGQHANAVAQEAQFKFAYNTSIVALEEAKGTLLAHDGIAVADPATPKRTAAGPKDDRVAPAAFQEPAPLATPAPAQSTATTYKLRAKLGGIKMWEIELEISQGRPAAPAR